MHVDKQALHQLFVHFFQLMVQSIQAAQLEFKLLGVQILAKLNKILHNVLIFSLLEDTFFFFDTAAPDAGHNILLKFNKALLAVLLSGD